MVRDVREALAPRAGNGEMKIRNRLEPASTEKLVCVYSNSCQCLPPKMVAATRDANELKMLAWLVDRMKVTASEPAAHGPAGGSQPG